MSDARPPLLSICIPTHDGRAKELGEALTSILDQLPPDAHDLVEICVSDNASADGTADLVRTLAEHHSTEIRYARFARNQGAPANVLRSVELATGEYCWLLSSDDSLAPGAIESVRTALATEPQLTGLSTNWSIFDATLHGLLGPSDPTYLPSDPERTRVLVSPDEILLELGLELSYMSPQVVRRSAWELAAVTLDRDAPGWRNGFFPHLVVIAAAVRAAPRWLWLAQPLIRRRAENESLPEVVGRGTGRIIATYFEHLDEAWRLAASGRTPVWRALMRDRALRIWGTRAVLSAVKRERAHTTAVDVRLLVTMVRRFYWLPAFWRQAFPLLCIPHQCVKHDLIPRPRRHD